MWNFVERYKCEASNVSHNVLPSSTPKVNSIYAYELQIKIQQEFHWLNQSFKTFVKRHTNN